MFALNLSASNRKEINFRSKGKGALHKTLCAAVIVAIASTGFSLGPAQASGTYNGTNGTILCSTSGFFTVSANAVTGHTECVGAVVIPATVTSIGSGGFAGSSINSVVFSSPSTLATIGVSAFQSIQTLTSITIPASVTSIGDSAFGFSNALTSIMVDASNANYSSVDGVLFDKNQTLLVQYPAGISVMTNSIPTSVTSIGLSAFRGTGLTSVTIPANVTSIGLAAFGGASLLTSVIFSGTSTLATIGDYAFQSARSLASITIPASVTSIGDSAFDAATSLASIVFSGTNTLASIGSFAFSGTSLTSFTIPASVTTIEANAFSGIRSLVSFTVAEANQNYSSVDGVLFDKQKTSLISYSIGNLRTTYSIPSSVTSIEVNAFNDASSLTSITIPSSVASIGARAFYAMSVLTSFTVAEANPNFSSVDGMLFDKQKTSLISYPMGRPGTTYSIPSSVTRIEAFALYGTRLTSITIPSSTTFIGNNAFMYASLRNVYFLGDAPTTVGSDAFDGVNGKAYTKSGAAGFGLANNLWNRLTVAVLDDGERPCTSGNYRIVDFVVTQGLSCAGVAAIAEGVRAIGDSSHSPFSGGDALTSVTIPASVTSIGNSAFQQTSALTSFSVDPANANFSSEDGVLFNKTKSSLLLFPAARGNAAYVVPTSVVTIGAEAFQYDRSLTSITISENVESIGNFAFRDANKLTSVTFSGTSRLASFGRMSFKQTKLETIIIPASVTVIGDETFAFAPLRTITFDENSLLTTIGEYGFYEASALASITIPASVTDIEDGVFWGARALANVVFLGNAPSVGADAFFDVAAGAKATVSASATGFPAVGGTWNGLTVQSSSAPAETPPPPAATPPAATPVATTPVTTTPAVDSAAQAAAADLASRTVSAKARFASKSLARRVGVKIVSSKAQVTFTVAGSSRKICVKSGTSLRTLKAGTCRVTFTVQEPNPKKGKALKPKRTTKTLVVR